MYIWWIKSIHAKKSRETTKELITLYIIILFEWKCIKIIVKIEKSTGSVDFSVEREIISEKIENKNFLFLY